MLPPGRANRSLRVRLFKMEANHDDADVVDVLIVGAGPVGLYASYYAGFRGLTTLVVDSLEEAGGQITAMYPEKLLYDIAGFPAVRGRELVSNLVQQAQQFDTGFLLGHQAAHLNEVADAFVVTTDRGVSIRARTVLITGGIGTFTPRPPGAGLEFLDRGLSYFVRDPEAMRDKQVVVVGGGDSAVDWALMLERIAAKVTLVHRRVQFRAHAHSVQLLQESGVSVLTNAGVVDVQGDSRLRSVTVCVKGGGSEVIEADALVSALGFIAELGPLLEWGLDTHDRYITVNQHMMTNREGIYAAGDIADFDGKVRLLAVGFGEAATAINNLAVKLHPEQSLVPAHSSDRVPEDALA